MIRVEPRCRVIIDNDWAGDPDGLIGLAHHALSPANRIIAVTGSLTNPMFGPPAGQALAGSALAAELLQVLAVPAPVHAGPDGPFTGRLRDSAAARAIVAAANADGDLPAVLVCAGPLTNVADALLADPGIAGRLTLAWVGGAAADADEYNYFTDPEAAGFVLGNPDLAVWQFPLETYRQLVVSLAELEHRLKQAGDAGAWLWERFDTLQVPDVVKFGPTWCLGDSAPLLVTGLDDVTSSYETTGTAPSRRLYKQLDSRLVVEDFFARLALNNRA